MKFTKQETIRFKHVDFAGIVFYPRFLEMLNDLVEDWFGEELDRPFSKIHETNGIPTVDLKVQFRKPARIGDELKKSLWVKNLGGASVTCGFDFRHLDDSVCLEGEVTLVNVGLDKVSNQIKAVPFADETKTRIQKFIIHNS
ncbi:MAG: acyl-CoA thioesterase [Flavobacterium sp.]|uniref:acyl-CoA thioesterase n=1 Tax=Flavobacterium sp. TaxID=239 RepID=UPI001223C7BC|nr:acyl-CoA thioesterase [Flavobacterium sp.]RZJ67327.1 MAG: acyl-CoA thioesterase [Flavobacterium sp.]